MTKDNGILILGLTVAITPFLGIPGEWKTVLFVSAGLLISFLIFLIKRDRDMPAGGEMGSYRQQASDSSVTKMDTTPHEENSTEEK